MIVYFYMDIIRGSEVTVDDVVVRMDVERFDLEGGLSIVFLGVFFLRSWLHASGYTTTAVAAALAVVRGRVLVAVVIGRAEVVAVDT